MEVGVTPRSGASGPDFLCFSTELIVSPFPGGGVPLMNILRRPSPFVGLVEPSGATLKSCPPKANTVFSGPGDYSGRIFLP
jgi:hypothetical protein